VAVDVSRMAQVPVPVEQQAAPQVARPVVPNPAPVRKFVRAASRKIWHLLVVAISGEGTAGIDESALPMGFMAPYAKGSRTVRNLWHLPF
jgi:hypothetical protein